jgi:hypothetical protein
MTLQLWVIYATYVAIMFIGWALDRCLGHLRQLRHHALVQGQSIDAHFEALHAHLRQDHLLVMKALKGDSYAGTIGGVEVHADPVLPMDHILLRSKDAFNDLIDDDDA